MNLKITTSLCLLVLFGASVPAGAQSNAGNGLDRMVRQLEQAFPVLEGVVLAVKGDTLTLDLKQGQPVQPGDLLTLIRFGEKIVHPVTQEVVGRQETDLGEIRVTEVRKDFSRARALELAPGNAPHRGDGVRSVFKKVSVLVAPIRSKVSSGFDTDALKLEMESRLAASSRFQVPDFDLNLWLLEAGLKRKDLTDSRNLARLKSQVEVDAIMVANVLNVRKQTVLSYKMIAAGSGEVIKTARLLVPNLAASSPLARNRTSSSLARSREPGEVQTDLQSSKGGLLRFVDKQEFDFVVVDFAVGDLNGNGKKEFVFIDDHRVLIYKYKNRKFHKIGQKSLPENLNRFLSVDVADINGNGRDEIFVTNHNADQLSSFVLEAVPGKKGLQKIWQEVNLYFRVIRSFDQVPRLIVQRPGFETPFASGISPIKFQNGRYQTRPELKLEPARTRFLIYGLTLGDISSQPALETIILDKNYQLRVYSSSGRVLVKSDDYFGHDPRIIDVGVKDVIPGLFNSANDPQPVNFRGRLELTRHSGRKYLVLPRNHLPGGNLLSGLVAVNNSNLVILGISREGLERVFETKKQKGYLAAFQVVDQPGSRSKQVYAVTVSNVGGPFSSKKISTVFTYDW